MKIRILCRVLVLFFIRFGDSDEDVDGGKTGGEGRRGGRGTNFW